MQKYYEYLLKSKSPIQNKIQNFPKYLKRQTLSKILVRYELFKKQLKVKGSIIECGVHEGFGIMSWGHFSSILEPYNYHRKIIGFDTFSGFPSVSSVDKKTKFNEVTNVGEFATTSNYEKYLQNLMDYHATETHAHHLKRHKIIKGDASKTIKKYLKDNPQTVIALAYFDVDLYKPTKDCLLAIEPYLTKGSVIGFDEPNTDSFPGETIAIREVFGSTKYKLYTSKFSAGSGYLIIE